jgi:peptidoglycan/LPS O-acetylase OafA/YrhL
VSAAPIVDHIVADGRITSTAGLALEMTHDQLALKYRPDLDGLRALAVLPVCFFHAGLPVFSGGFVGVSVFFVISGYLMASTIGQHLSRGDFAVADFYERRVRRIFPALFLVLFCCCAVAVATVPPKLFRDFGLTLVATVFFASNLLFWWKTDNYFDATTEWNPLLHTWSLAVEEQFYILFPLFLVLIWRFGRSWRLGLTAFIAVISLALSVWGTANAPTASFYMLPTRAWELLLGALVALWTPAESRQPAAGTHSRLASSAGGLLGLALVLGSSLWFDKEMAFPGASALVPTVGAALLIHSGQNGLNPVARLLSLAPFTQIGKISYSLYLWHWPLLVFTDKYKPFGTLGALHKAAVIGVSCLLAYASWRWVEQPFRGRQSFIDRPRLFRAAAACMGLTGIAGALAQINSGWTARFPGLASVSFTPQDTAERRDEYSRAFATRRCFTMASTWAGERCYLSRHATSNALLWGDSFAASYAAGFFRNERFKFNVLQYTAPSCPPIVGYDAASTPYCAPFNSRVAAIIKEYDISTVIMAADWSAYYKRRKLRDSDIESSVRALRSLGIRTVVIGQSPVFPFVYPDEYFFKVFGSQLNEREYRAPVDFDPGINRQMAKIASIDNFFDPLAVLCNSERSECTFKQGTSYVFRDYGHYTHYGSKKVVGALLDAMNGVQIGSAPGAPAGDGELAR